MQKINSTLLNSVLFFPGDLPADDLRWKVGYQQAAQKEWHQRTTNRRLHLKEQCAHVWRIELKTTAYIELFISKYFTDHVPCQGVSPVPNNPGCLQPNSFGALLSSMNVESLLQRLRENQYHSLMELTSRLCCWSVQPWRAQNLSAVAKRFRHLWEHTSDLSVTEHRKADGNKIWLRGSLKKKKKNEKEIKQRNIDLDVTILTY